MMAAAGESGHRRRPRDPLIWHPLRTDTGNRLMLKPLGLGRNLGYPVLVRMDQEFLTVRHP